MSIKLNAPKAMPLLHAAGKLIADAVEMQPANETQRFGLEMRGCHLHQGTDAAPQEMRTAAYNALDLMWQARKVLVGDGTLPEPLATHFAEIDDGLRCAWSGGGSYDDVLWDVEGASEAFTEFMESLRAQCPLYRVAEHRAALAPRTLITTETSKALKHAPQLATAKATPTVRTADGSRYRFRRRRSTLLMVHPSGREERVVSYRDAVWKLGMESDKSVPSGPPTFIRAWTTAVPHVFPFYTAA